MSEPLTAKPWSERHIADLRSYHQPCGWSCASKTKGEECWAARWLATLDAARSSPAPTEGLDVERLDNDLRSFVANVETSAEDNGTPAVLLDDLWALARDWMRDRTTHPDDADAKRRPIQTVGGIPVGQFAARLSPPVDRDAPREPDDTWTDLVTGDEPAWIAEPDRDAPREGT